MKKSLLALAVLAAAGAANAQVTVYGALDASYSNIETGGVNLTAQGNQDNFASSILGLKGSEDLGGGLKASFNLEGDINTSTGAGDASNGLTFDRQSWVALSNSTGEIKIGRTSDFQKDIQGRADAGMGLFDNSTAILGNRYANVTKVTTRVMGWTVGASYTNDTAPTNNAGNIQGQHMTTFGLQGNVAGVNVGIATAEQYGDQNSMTVALGYDFGFAAADFVYNSLEVGTVNSSDVRLGVVVPVGQGFDVRGVYQQYNHDTAASEFKIVGLAAHKALSKRTGIYAGYEDKDVATTSATDVTIATVGVYHKF